MEKQAKKKETPCEKSQTFKKKIPSKTEENKTPALDTNTPLTLEALTSPDKE